MRNALLIAAACTAVSSQAAIWQLDFGPKVGEFGLNGLNERPVPVTPSTATGREVQDYNSQNFMQYDDTLNQIELHFGWGNLSEVGGTDLSSAFTAMHIHGPGDVNTSADVLYNLVTEVGSSLDTQDQLLLRNSDRAGLYDVKFNLREGVGGFTIEQQEQQLLDGLWYVNIHSVNYASGEIRGQLLAIPEPQHYAAFAGLALLGFAGYRRFKAAPAA